MKKLLTATAVAAAGLLGALAPASAITRVVSPTVTPIRTSA